MPLVWHEDLRYLTPEFLPVFPVQAEHNHLVCGVGILDPEDPFRLILRLRKRRVYLTRVDSRGQENSIAPHDRAGGSPSFHRCLPGDVPVLTPLGRWICGF